MLLPKPRSGWEFEHHQSLALTPIAPKSGGNNAVEVWPDHYLVGHQERSAPRTVQVVRLLGQKLLRHHPSILGRVHVVPATFVEALASLDRSPAPRDWRPSETRS